MKVSHCQQMQKNILMETGQKNPYLTTIEALKLALHETTEIAWSIALRTQLEPARERRILLMTHRKEFIIP